MDDVQKHLAAALDALTKEQADLAQRLRELREKESTIRSLLAGTNGASGSTKKLARSGRAIADLVLSQLDLHGEVSLEQIRHAADQAGIPYKDTRSFAAVMAGLFSHGRVEKTDEGNWRLKK